MLAVQFSQFGPGDDVAEVIELPEPGRPGPGQVLVDVLAAAINSSDLLTFKGKYGTSTPKLPMLVGADAVGRVAEVGEDVRNVKVGDRVLCRLGGRGNWCQRKLLSAEPLFPLPEHADTLQLAMASVNPGTAWLMLTKFVNLQPGDWIVQNASFSGVGHSVVRIAKREGFRTVSIVRREAQVEALLRSGGDLVLMNSTDVAAAVRSGTQNAMAKLGLDAVGGGATQQLAACMADHGTIVSYGLLSGEPCEIMPADVIFRDISLRGFWFSRWQQTTTPQEKRELFARVCRYVEEGVIHVPVAATYDIRDVRRALRHAATPGKDGKIIILPNGVQPSF